MSSHKKWSALLRFYYYLSESLRGYYSIYDAQFIIAVLLYLKRLLDIGEIQVDPNREFSTLQELISAIKLTDKQDHRDQNILIEFQNSLRKSTDNNIEYLDFLFEYDTRSFSDAVYGDIFHYFVSLNSFDSQKSPIIYTPHDITDLMTGILAPRDGAVVYDPAAGTGGLLIEVLKKDQIKAIKGIEINQRIASFGYMNLVMHGYFKPNFHAQDCFRELSANQIYDYILTDLPFTGIFNNYGYYQLYKNYGIEVPSSGKGFGALVLFIISKLSRKGKAVFTVSDSFLFKQGKEKEIRHLMLQQDIIEAIISLPHGALRPYTEAKASIMILNKQKSPAQQNRIMLFEVDKIAENKSSVSLNTTEIITQYCTLGKDNNKVHSININEIGKDLNLSVGIYTSVYQHAQKMILDGTGKFLNDLVSIKGATTINKQEIITTGLPIVKIENLSKDILDLNLQTDVAFDCIAPSTTYKSSLIDSACILVARVGDNLKPTCFKPTSEIPAIMLHSGVLALIPISSSIDLEYLYYQLHSDFVKEQIKQKRQGAVMPSISMTNLRLVIIPYVNISAQKDFVQSQKANIIAAERAKVEEKIKALDYKEELRQTESGIVRTLVHQLRPTLVQIDNNVNTILRIVARNHLSDYSEGIAVPIDPELRDMVVPVQDINLSEITNQLKEKTLVLNRTLTTVNKVMNYKISLQEMTEVDLMEYFESYISSKINEYIDKFQIELTGEHIRLKIHVSSFDDLISQLLINAESHGFSDGKLPVERRKVQFNLSFVKERQVAIVEYKNNGAPFLLSQRDYTTPFIKSQSSSGSGIGGSYISRIVDAHKGGIKVKEGLKTGFSMIIEIPLNIK